MLVSLFKKVM